MRHFLQILIAATLFALVAVVGQMAEPLLLDDSPAAAVPVPEGEAGMFSAWSVAVESLGKAKDELSPAFSVAGRMSRDAFVTFQDQVLAELLVGEAGRLRVFKEKLDRGYSLPGPLGEDLGILLRAKQQRVFLEYQF